MFFEDFVVGTTDRFGEYTVTEAEVKEFASKYDPQYFHLDHEAAKDSLFKGLCASGWHTGAMFMRMLVDNMPEGQGSLGSPGLDKLNWVSPVYPGYVLSVISTVIDTRLSESKPGVGIITLAYQVVNQDTKIVMTVSSKAFFRCRNT